MRQNFRLHKLGFNFRLCHIITCNRCQTWGLFYSCVMRTLPMSCHVVLHVQCCHACIVWHMHAGMPAILIKCGMPEITYGHAVRASRPIYIKINCLTFQHPKYEICKPECAGKDSRVHVQREHGQIEWEFQGRCRGICSTSVQVVGFIRPLGAELHQKLV